MMRFTPSTEGDTNRAQQVAKAVLALLLVGLGLWTLHIYLPALIWACILAIAVWPSYQRALRRWPSRRHNILLPALFTLGIGVIFIAPLAMLGVQAARELHSLYQIIDTARTAGIPPPDWLHHLPFGEQFATDWWKSNLSNAKSASALLRRARRVELVTTSGQLGADIAHRLVLFAFTLLTLFFVFREGERLAAQMLHASARAFGSAGERLGRQMIASVRGTVDGLVLVGLGEGVVIGIGYLLAGLPHATLFGLFTGIAAMVPFGAPLIFSIAAATLLVRGAVAWAIGIVLLGILVTFVADHFVRPVIIGSSMRLPFLWVLLGILGGVEAWGFLGLFLGPAIMAGLMLLWREWTDTSSG